MICVKHRYVDQVGNTPCPECEEELFVSSEASNAKEVLD
jgi:hypothetical protein